MKSGEHDWQHIKLCLLQKRWETNPSSCYLPITIQGLRKILIDKVLKDTEKVSKDKVKVSCATVIYEYNQHMGGVNLFGQVKVSILLLVCQQWTCFSIAYLMMRKFLNRKRATPMHRPSKFLKGRVLTRLIICLSFDTPAWCSLRLRIANVFVVCPALSDCVSRKKENDFNNTTWSNAQENFMSLYILSWIYYLLTFLESY